MIKLEPKDEMTTNHERKIKVEPEEKVTTNHKRKIKVEPEEKEEGKPKIKLEPEEEVKHRRLNGKLNIDSAGSKGTLIAFNSI